MALTNIINALLRLHEVSRRDYATETCEKRLVSTKLQSHLPVDCSEQNCRKIISVKYQRHTEEELRILLGNQFGFRQRPFTENQKLLLVEYATDGLNRKLTSGVVFLEVNRAFDRVWYEGLIHRINRVF